MATRRAEVIYVGDAASIVRAAKQAEVAQAQLAAAAKKSGDEVAAANRKATDATVAGAGKQQAAHAKSMASIGSVGSAFTKLTAPILLAAGAGAKFAIDFQSQMERVHTQAGVTQAGVEQLSKGVLAMAGPVAQAPQALAEGMYHVASSLNATLPAATAYSTELQVLKTAAEGATVGHANLVDVTNALDAAVISGMKGVQNYSQAMGALNAVVGAGDMTMQNLAEALGTGILGPMKTFGVSLQDVGGALAVFGDNNIRGEDAATKLISAVRIMAAPSKAAAKELAGVGLSTLSLANDIRSGGLVKALADLKTHLVNSGDTASQQGLIVARAFGGRQSTGVQLLLAQLDRLRAKTAQVGAGAQDFGNAWSATQQTAAYKMQSALDSMKADITSFGNSVLPPLLSVLSTVTRDVGDVAKAFASLPSGAQHAIVTGGLILAGIGPALKILGVFSSGIGRLWQIAQLISGTRVIGGLGGAGGAGAVATGAESAAATGGISGTLKGALSRGVGGLALGSFGVLIAQEVGSAVHGGVGEGIKTIGTDTAIGAGLGSIFGPAGTAGGALIGGLVGSFQFFITNDAARQGKEFAQKFTADLPSEISKQTTAALAKAKTQAIKDNAPGGQFGRSAGQPIVAAELSASRSKAFFNEGYTAGQAVVQGLKSVKTPTTQILFGDFVLKLKALSAQARPEAARLMLEYAHGLEANKRLPKGAVDDMIGMLENQFPALRGFLKNQGLQTDREFGLALKFTNATATLKNTLSNFRSQYGDLAISAKLTDSNLNQNTQQAMIDLRTIIVTSIGQTRKDAIAELNKLEADTKNTFTAMGQQVAAAAGQMHLSVKDGSALAYRDGAANWSKFAKSIGGAMAAGVLSVQEGAKIIGDGLNSVLKSFGEKPLSLAQIQGLGPAITQAVASGQVSSGGAASPHAGGGLVQFGRAGDKGRDNIPVNFGGRSIAVGSGEVGAVFNHTQQRNFAEAYPGGLPGFFSNPVPKHYMASGGLMGNVPAMIAEANRVTAHHFPYLWGGGHGSFAGPYDCSGAVSDILHAGGVLNAPRVSGDFMNYGLPGPGAVTLYANPTHVYMSIDGRFFGTSGSNPGGGAGWFAGSPRPGFAVRHIGGGGSGGGQIPVPKVLGKGTIPTIVRAALGRIAGAANSKLSSLLFSGSWGGGQAGEPGVESEVFKFFSAQGFDKIAIAGMLGNAQQESSMNPSAPGGGLWQQISNFGAGAPSLMVQMRTMLPQILGLRGAMNRAKSPGDAATIFMDGFERPGIPALSNRIAGANAAFAAGFGGGGIPFVGSFKTGGHIKNDGLAYVHEGETILPVPTGVEGITTKKLIYPVVQLITALTGLSKQTKLVTGDIAKLTQLKAFTDAISAARTNLQSLAQQAAQAWNANQQKGIGATHDAAIKAISGGADATTLATMQTQDAATQNARTLEGLNKTLTDAQTLAAHSGGQAHVDALQQVKDAQAAIEDFNRQQTEQQLQDNITAATKKADDAQTVALAGLDQQTADYQNSLAAQLGALTDNLAKRKVSYATWAQEVDAVLAPYGLSASTDSTTEASIVAGPGPLGSKPVKKAIVHKTVHHAKKHRASGGPVEPGYVYRVGEQGPEDVIFGRRGTVLNANETRANDGGVHFHGPINVQSIAAAKALADRLAFKAHIGVA